jgi:hypothetical protein
MQDGVFEHLVSRKAAKVFDVVKYEKPEGRNGM